MSGFPILKKSQLSKQLRELLFLFQSLYFFLEHLDTRLHHWEKLFQFVITGVFRNQQRSQLLEQELENSVTLVSELQEEIQALTLAVQAQWETDPLVESQILLGEKLLQESKQLQASLVALETLEEKLLYFQTQLLNLKEKALCQQNELEQSRKKLFESQQALTALKKQNQALLQALQVQRQLSETQIESLNELIEKTSREAWQLKQENQELQVLHQQIQELEQECLTLRQRLHNHSPPTELHHVIPHLQPQHIRFQSFLELSTFLPLNPEEKQALIQTLGQRLHIPPLHQEVLQRKVSAGQGVLNHLLAEYRPNQRVNQPYWEQRMVLVPAGVYPIGDPFHAAERPAHSQKTEGFLLDIFPVTNADYAQFIADGGYSEVDLWLPAGWRLLQEQNISAPAFWNLKGHACGEDYPDYPVVGVSWYEAMAYARWRGLRLPTEIEWEMACRGVDGYIWPWGNQWEPGRANTAESGILNLCPVGSFPEGQSPVGCHDMIGQVYEWTSSLYQAYPYHRDDGRESPFQPGPRTLRGCSWSTRGSYFSRAAYRFLQPPEHRHSDIGFRCAMDLPVQKH